MRALALLAVLATNGCSTQLVDAVTGTSCEHDSSLPGCGGTSWPTDSDRANSSPWLRANHDQLTTIRPRVLVLDYYNGPVGGSKFGLEQMRAFVERQIQALAEGSRYHGYADPGAPAFVNYQLVKIVDLTDPDPTDSAFPSSTKLPLTANGAFDVAALFTPEYAEVYGISAPGTPDDPLTLCELFQTGEINELWISVTDPDPRREPPSMLECKAVYDAQGERVPGEYVSLTGSDFCAVAEQCGVTVRIAHLSVARNIGCDLQVRGWGITNSVNAIPYLGQHGRHFFNRDLADRYASFNVTFNSLSEICSPNPERRADLACVQYPNQTTARFVRDNIVIQPYDQGCGDTDHPPNARWTWDWDNDQPVEASCESYGIPGAAPAIYQFSGLPAYEDLFPDLPGDTGFSDCGGPWQLYWRQNIPGLNNRARTADATPMKNWWPFLFY